MQFKIQAITNEHFNANTYLLESNINDTGCYLIDTGNTVAIIKLLKKNQSIKGIFLTHGKHLSANSID
jgi:glyoxylase-like metal-dependent hydrolase (beta-lactamase superfamily II)